MLTGFLLGKFLPPHKGHLYLIEYARQRVDQLTVLVCSLQREPIPGVLRYQWLCELCPGVNVQHSMAEIPSYPEEHPDFWNIWHRTIRHFLPTGPDIVFSSETYGEQLAALLGARHECVDLQRQTFPISGTLARQNPFACWAMLPPPVQAYYREMRPQPRLNA